MRYLLALALLLPLAAQASTSEAVSEISKPLNHYGNQAARTMGQWKDSAEAFLGMEVETVASYPCSTPSFFMLKQQHNVYDQSQWLLKGSFPMPNAGFKYRFTMTGVQAPQAFATLQIGQPVTAQYRQQPAAAPLQVVEKLQLPQNIAQIRIRVEGLAPQAQEFTCDITPPQMQPMQPAPLPPQ